jgi:hypothetical protein
MARSLGLNIAQRRSRVSSCVSLLATVAFGSARSKWILPFSQGRDASPRTVLWAVQRKAS